jgi:TRAP-type C4-dicarboxylate transport system permease large subunit
MDEGMSHLILLSVPLFVFLGLLIEMTGMARAMVAFLASLLGHVRGGLHYVLVGAMYLVSGISGSKAADMAFRSRRCSPGGCCPAWSWRSRSACWSGGATATRT